VTSADGSIIELSADNRVTTDLKPSLDSVELIRDFKMIHVIPDPSSPDRAEFAVPLFEKGPPRQNQGIQVTANFTQPVFCYLLALNPDGVKQLCYPGADDEVQGEPIPSLRYPIDEDSAFGLTDGVGEQAFVLMTSLDPLPAFQDWESDLVNATWPDPDVTGNWIYQHGDLASIDAPQRGAPLKFKMPTKFKQQCDQLREVGMTDVRGVIFEVQPQ
jgi:hypothetical protein